MWASVNCPLRMLKAPASRCRDSASLGMVDLKLSSSRPACDDLLVASCHAAFSGDVLVDLPEQCPPISAETRRAGGGIRVGPDTGWPVQSLGSRSATAPPRPRHTVPSVFLIAPTRHRARNASYRACASRVFPRPRTAGSRKGLSPGTPAGASSTTAGPPATSRRPGCTCHRRPGVPAGIVLRPHRSDRVARMACHVLNIVPTRSDEATSAVVVRTTRFRLANFRNRYHRRRRAGLDRLVGQVPHHVGREVVGRLVPPAAGPSPAPSSRSSRARRERIGRGVGGRSCDSPRSSPRVSPERAEPGARLRRLLLADDPTDLVERRLAEASRSSNGVVPVSSS